MTDEVIGSAKSNPDEPQGYWAPVKEAWGLYTDGEKVALVIAWGIGIGLVFFTLGKMAA